MMKAIIPFRTGHFEQCDLGTLVGLRTRNGRIAYAIMVGLQRDIAESKLLILQDWDTEGAPWFEYHHSKNECFIFGDEWIFELLSPDDGADFTNIDTGQRPGGVLIKYDVAALRVGRNPHDNRPTPGYVDIRTWYPVDQPHTGLIGASNRWKIWSGEAERTRIGGEPLLSFNCSP